jgi:surface antigen
MILLTNGVSIPHQQAIITLIEKPPAIVQQVKPELTVEEKIKLNYYKCDTNIQYIRADNATCLAKPVQTPQTTTKAQKPVKSSQNSSVSVNGNSYQPGQCVWYVKNLKPEIPNGWGNASNWLYAAQADGWATGTEPRVGAVGWTSGHVVFITGVNSDGTVNYTDMNGNWIPYEVGSGTVSASKYQYIY